jgi:hypothetical protein
VVAERALAVEDVEIRRARGAEVLRRGLRGIEEVREGVSAVSYLFAHSIRAIAWESLKVVAVDRDYGDA